MDVYEWAMGARLGERVRYYLCIEAGHVPSRVLLSSRRASDEGLVFLAQRRTYGGFAYEATRISPETARLLGLVGDRSLNNVPFMPWRPAA